MELNTLLDAHPFHDLQADVGDLVREVELGGDEATIQALLHRVAEAQAQYTAFLEDLNQWCQRSCVTVLGKQKVKYCLSAFCTLIVDAVKVLKTVGHVINVPPDPSRPYLLYLPLATALKTTKRGRHSDGS